MRLLPGGELKADAEVALPLELAEEATRFIPFEGD